ncbi:MAG: hypothetical protein V2B18_21240 [Pseudomonadota bacterium]
MALRPTSDTALQRPDLGQIAYEINTDAPTMGYIGGIVFPDFPVPVSSMEYPVMPKEALLQLLDTSRGPYGHYNRWEAAFESGHFKTTERGLEAKKDDRYAKLYATLFDYEASLSRLNQEGILRKKEYDIAAKVFNTTQFTPNNASVAWSTAATAAPRTDILAAKAAMRALGVVPNALIIPYQGLLWLQNMTAVQSAITNLFADPQRTGMIEVRHLEAYLEISQIIVAGSQYNSARRGQSATIAEIWGSRYAMLARIASPGDDIKEPCIGRTFRWNEGANEEIIVEDYRDETVRADIIRNRHDVDYAYIRSYDDSGAVKSDISAASGYLIDMTAAT